MKTKKFEKKLALNKVTVMKVAEEDMNAVRGGTIYTMDGTACDTHDCTRFIPFCRSNICP